MTETFPPFNPPYITFSRDGEEAYRIETLADGSKRTLAMPTENFPPMLPDSDTRSEPRPSNSKSKTNIIANGDKKAALYLNVPFADKDNAKSLGAKWDATSKKWFVPHGTEITGFRKWWPDSLKT